MTPKDFINKWGVSRAQLSLLLGVSQASIDHWFSPKSPREPPETVLLRLDEIDAMFDSWKIYKERTPHVWEVFQDLQQD